MFGSKGGSSKLDGISNDGSYHTASFDVGILVAWKRGIVLQYPFFAAYIFGEFYPIQYYLRYIDRISSVFGIHRCDGSRRLYLLVFCYMQKSNDYGGGLCILFCAANISAGFGIKFLV